MGKSLVDAAAHAVADVAEKHHQMPKIKEKVSQTSVVLPQAIQKKESKWRQALMRRKEKLQLEIERKRREDEELEKNREAARIQRQMSINFPKLSRLALIQEKQHRVEELNKKKILLKVKAKVDESKRKSDRQTWWYIIRQARNLQSIVKAEQDLEKERERAELEEKQRKYREAKLAERLKNKIENKKWQKRISRQVRKATEKLRKKRREEQRNTTLFMSRFRKIQLEIKKRKRREKMRELRKEEERLQEKKKRQEKELIRRAEVSAHLDRMQKIQQLHDKKRLEWMERLRKKHEAEHAVYEAQKKIMQDVVEEIKKHHAKMKKQRELYAKEKFEAKKKIKQNQEIQRRVAVSAAVTKNRKLARALAARRANQLAAEETAWKLKKKQNLKYNQWVREHWAMRAKEARQRKLMQQIKEIENSLMQNEKKKQAELKRRECVKQRIAKHQQKEYNKNKNRVVVPPPSSLTRRQFLELQQEQRDIYRQRQIKVVKLSCLHSEERRKFYSKIQDMELQQRKDNKTKVIQKATKRAWR